MSDNVTELELDSAPKGKGLWKKILALAAVVLVVLSVLAVILFRDSLNLDNLRRWVKYMNVNDSVGFGTYSFDSHSSNRYCSFDDGLIVASVSGLNAYDENGGELFVLQKQMALPEIMVNGDLALAYDVGGNALVALHARNGEVLRLDESRPILDADLSTGGAICLSSSASGYKSVLSVYDNQQQLIYRWLSSTTYIPYCAISPDGKMLAAIGLGQSFGTYESTLYFFRTDSEEVQMTVSLGSDLVYDVMFTDSGNICVIGETGVQYVDQKGEHLGTYVYEEPYLKDYDAGGNGFLTLSVNMYRAGNRYTLVTVDEKGQKIAESYIGQEILDLSACGRYIAVLTSEGLTIYTQDLSIYDETIETGNATAVVMREDGSVLLLGNGQGRLYVP